MRRNNNSPFLSFSRLAIAASAVWYVHIAGAAEPPDYNQHVAPLFKKYCSGCHNAQDHEGDLVLDRYQALLDGGKHGAAIVPRKSSQSRLIKLLSGKALPEMPPEGNERPKPEEIAILAAWIDAGAKGPEGAEPDPRALLAPKIKPAAGVRVPVTAVAAAPDGKHIAVARHDSIDWLSAPDRTLVRRLTGHRGRVNALSFSADGGRLVAAAGEPGLFGEARLWNAADGTLIRTFQGHKDSLYAALLSPDGKTLATGSYDQHIKLWDVADGKELRTLAGHNDAVYDLAFRPDGKVLASASGDRTVKLWNVASGERLDTLGQSLKELYTVAFSPDGKRVAAGGVDNRIRVWQVSAEAKENTNPLVFSRFAHEGAVIKLAYSPDGRTLVSAAEDRTVKFWDAETLLERQPVERQPDWAPALAVSPDSKSVLVGRLDGSLAVYDTSTAQLILPPPPATPELTQLSQRGLQRGVPARVKLSGKNLADVASVKSSHEKLAARIIPATATATEVDVELAAAADLAPGRYELWLTGPAGESEKRAVLVDSLPQSSESEPNDALAAANPVKLPVDVWGVLAATGDVDNYVFEAKAGQTIVLAVDAATIGSKANAMLTLFDAAGRVLAANNDFDNTADPMTALRIPADGRYTVQVKDLVLSGSREHFYRLSIGEFAAPTAVFPLSIAANRPAEIEISGFNIPVGTKVKVPATAAGEVEVPLDPNIYRLRRPLKVVVGTLPEYLEVEPNDEPAQATPIQVPATVNGRIWPNRPGQKNDVDLYRFESKAGQAWIIETEAAQRGSPVDTVVDVLHADGRPVQRLLLQATRDSYVTFRGIDATQRDCRLANWEEMELNEYLYMNGEVCKLFLAPQGPDSGYTFYEGHGGKRRAEFDTTATAHALDEPAYIVEPHPPGSKLISSGLPVFTLYYENDDDSERRLGSDSRLTFVAPADGAYLVRVRDSQGHGGQRYAYRLTIRQPKPDFNVTLAGPLAAVAAGSGKAFTLNVERIDGFDGEVKIDVSGVPAGFSVSTPLLIQAGQRSATGVLFADAKAAAPAAGSEPAIKATALLDGREATRAVAGFGPIRLSEKPQVLVRMEPAEITLAPGTTVAAMLKIERNGLDDIVTFGVQNLPHGVIVDNIGLNGVLMLKGQSERQIFLKAARWVPETSRTCFALAREGGGQGSRPVMLHVRKPAAADEAAKRP
jgi:WD40 repeat protein